MKQFRQFLKAQNLIDGQLVAIDGTKIKANSCRDMLNSSELQEMIHRGEEGINKYLDELDILISWRMNKNDFIRCRRNGKD
ncbi:MAG: hypothetical protein IPN18_10915 [Ignavibacteriales bacterium]|nr:hypothetical protein [Ignavibacteriales bacterium]